MALLDRIKKLERLKASNVATNITWIDAPDKLSIEQIESKTDIYIYLEI